VSETSAFLQLYDDALPHVYGYLARRCANNATAEASPPNFDKC
jgi:DNA-directed RNA polymerase specialized sigma24 family protein